MEYTLSRKAVTDLSAREAEVLNMVVAGRSSVTIGIDLGLSRRMVDTHRRHIMRKLKARNTADLVRIAILGN